MYKIKFFIILLTLTNSFELLAQNISQIEYKLSEDMIAFKNSKYNIRDEMFHVYDLCSFDPFKEVNNLDSSLIEKIEINRAESKILSYFEMMITEIYLEVTEYTGFRIDKKTIYYIDRKSGKIDTLKCMLNQFQANVVYTTVNDYKRGIKYSCEAILDENLNVLRADYKDYDKIDSIRTQNEYKLQTQNVFKNGQIIQLDTSIDMYELKARKIYTLQDSVLTFEKRISYYLNRPIFILEKSETDLFPFHLETFFYEGDLLKMSTGPALSKIFYTTGYSQYNYY